MLRTGVIDGDLRCGACGVQYPRTPAAHGAPPVALLTPDPYGHGDGQAAVAAILPRLNDLTDLYNDPAQAHLRPWIDALLTWAPAHFGAFAEPTLTAPDPRPLCKWLAALDDLPEGPVLVLGAAACGEVCALPFADRGVVAVEANPLLLGWAAGVAAGGETLPYRHTASQFKTARLALPAVAMERLRAATLLCADALDPPFLADSFAAIVCLNLVDSLSNPEVLLHQCQALLAPAGALLLASPWHWSDAITPAEARLDRHFDPDLDHAWQMSSLLTGALVSGFMDQMRLQRSADHLDWRIRMHERMTARYDLQALLLRKVR